MTGRAVRSLFIGYGMMAANCRHHPYALCYALPFSGLATLAPRSAAFPFIGARYARPSSSLRSPVGLPSPLRLLRPASTFPALSWPPACGFAATPPPTPVAPSPPVGALATRSVWSRRLVPSPRLRLFGGVCCAYRRLICLVAEFCPAVVVLRSRWRSFGSPCCSRPTSALALSASCAQCAAGRAIAPSFLGESGSGLRPRFFSAAALSLRLP